MSVWVRLYVLSVFGGAGGGEQVSIFFVGVIGFKSKEIGRV